MYMSLPWENLFMSYANNKDKDQPAHPCSLINNFVFAAYVVPMISISKIWKPASFLSWAGQFESYQLSNLLY